MFLGFMYDSLKNKLLQWQRTNGVSSPWFIVRGARFGSRVQASQVGCCSSSTPVSGHVTPLISNNITMMVELGVNF